MDQTQPTAAQNDYQAELDKLKQDIERLSQDVDKSGQASQARLETIAKGIRQTGAEIKEITGRLDAAEKQAGDEIDKLILEQEKDLEADDAEV